MLYQLAKLYAHLVKFSIERFNYSPPGLGYLLRRVKSQHTIDIDGRRFLFSRQGASMYGLMILNEYRERETHDFLRQMIESCLNDVSFIDVGAAVGEIAIDVAGYARVQRVYAIDPDADNLKAIERSAELNGFSNISLIESVVADQERPVSFVLNKDKGSSGYIDNSQKTNAETMKATTIDAIFDAPDVACEHILLIDAEGADCKVVQGASQYISKVKPLVVFEFNELSRKHFSLADMQRALGDDYEVYRLNQKAQLDKRFDDAWNCVAVSRDSSFYEPCSLLVSPAREAVAA